LIISTKEGLDFTGAVSITFEKENGCQALNGDPILVPINVQVCGNEKLSEISTKEMIKRFIIGETKDR